MPWAKSTLLQRPYGFQPSQHSDNPVVLTGIRNGVYMRASAHDCRRWIRTTPPHERISNCILSYCEPRSLAARFHPCASLEVRRCENNSRYGGGRAGLTEKKETRR